MPIKSSNFNVAGQGGVQPTFAFLETNDTVAQVTAAGYLNGLVAEGISLTTKIMVLVSTKLTPNAQTSEIGWFEVELVGEEWTLIPPQGQPLYLPNDNIWIGNAANVATPVVMSGDITITNTGVTLISNGAVTNAKVSATAAIAFSKLAALPSADILVGSAGNVATAVAMSGNVTISNTGVTTIGAGVIYDSMINPGAQIAFSKLAPLTSAEIILGNTGGVPTATPVTGDISISSTGVTAIGAGAVSSAKIANNAVGSTQLALNMLQLFTINMTAAQWNAAYATPFAVPNATAVAGSMWLVDTSLWNYHYGTTAFAGGGVSLIQYGATADGGGVPATSTLAASGFSDQTHSVAAKVGGVFAAAALTGVVDAGLYVSNQSGPFTTGDGTFTIYVWAKLVAVS